MAEPEELNEDSLFDQAVGEETSGTAAAEPVIAEAAPEKQEGEVVAETAAEKPAVDDNAAHVPSWRVREINEEKRAALAELEALKAERQQWRQQPAQKTEPPAKAITPDPLLDPDGYKAAIREELRQERLAEVREDSLQRAREANPKYFDEAFAAAQMAVDPALKARMQSSRDPGKTLLEWHREVKTRQEIGGDLAAYKQRLRDEALKDPEFRKAAMAAWQSEAQPSQVNGRPRVELPPSLNGASRSNAALRSAMTADIDDDALFEQTTA